MFASGYLLMWRKNQKKPFAWTNCERLDKLAELNRKINAGATLTSLRNHFTAAEELVTKQENLLARLNADTTLPQRLYDVGFNYFNYGNATDNEKELLKNFKITVSNYKQSAEVVAERIATIEKTLAGNREKLRESSDTLTLAEKVAGGTFVQSLIDDDQNRRLSPVVPNGIKSADGDNTKIEEVIRIVVNGKKR